MPLTYLIYPHRFTFTKRISCSSFMPPPLPPVLQAACVAPSERPRENHLEARGSWSAPLTRPPREAITARLVHIEMLMVPDSESRKCGNVNRPRDEKEGLRYTLRVTHRRVPWASRGGSGGGGQRRYSSPFTALSVTLPHAFCRFGGSPGLRQWFECDVSVYRCCFPSILHSNPSHTPPCLSWCMRHSVTPDTGCIPVYCWQYPECYLFFVVQVFHRRNLQRASPTASSAEHYTYIFTIAFHQ
ncbi:hypothetical protein E2C01_071135 [Portunus trituberculatus]|uniref:Uncharacterized protein n=1 Tax=Portunus trituberculatus TaxID=210409 RepID=A0A5B7I4E0_PORTR|nr:hypothetical protein [Portunus trituberculatus]